MRQAEGDENNMAGESKWEEVEVTTHCIGSFLHPLANEELDNKIERGNLEQHKKLKIKYMFCYPEMFERFIPRSKWIDIK